MVDLQRVRSMAMEASAGVVPSCLRSLARTSAHRVRGAPQGTLGAKITVLNCVTITQSIWNMPTSKYKVYIIFLYELLPTDLAM